MFGTHWVVAQLMSHQEKLNSMELVTLVWQEQLLFPCIMYWGPLSRGYATEAWRWTITSLSSGVKKMNKVISVPSNMRIVLGLFCLCYGTKLSFTGRLAGITRIYTIFIDNFSCKGFQPIVSFICRTYTIITAHVWYNWPWIAFFYITKVSSFQRSVT
jgi:hypothetical protein